MDIFYIPKDVKRFDNSMKAKKQNAVTIHTNNTIIYIKLNLCFDFNMITNNYTENLLKKGHNFINIQLIAAKFKLNLCDILICQI
jgi:hypothetical protein